MKNTFYISIISMAVFCSCHNKPSEDEVKNCILKQYECGDNAKIISFKVENSAPLATFPGMKGYEFIVSGQIEWIKDCQSLFQVIPAGHVESFQNKEVDLVKMDKGWSCP